MGYPAQACPSRFCPWWVWCLLPRPVHKRATVSLLLLLLCQPLPHAPGPSLCDHIFPLRCLPGKGRLSVCECLCLCHFWKSPCFLSAPMLSRLIELRKPSRSISPVAQPHNLGASVGNLSFFPQIIKRRASPVLFSPY